MNIKDMELFLDVYRNGSITGTAEKHFISAQGLSNVIRRMEEELGAELFYRTPRGVQSTEYGALFYEQARKIVSDYRDVQNQIKALQAQNNGYVKMASAFGVLRQLTPQFVQQFQNCYENYQMDYAEYPDLMVEEAMLRDEADVGITPNPDETLFDAQELYSARVYFVAHERSQFFHRESVSLKEIVQEPLVIENRRFRIHHELVESCRRQGLEPKIYFNTSGFSLCYKICRSGETNTLTLDFIHEDMQGGTIRRIPLEDPLEWRVCIITRKGRPVSKAVRNFIQFTKQWCESHTVGV